MKRKLLLTGVLSMLVVLSVLAQRQKTTINFLGEFDWNFRGDYTYSFVMQENGQELKDGPFQMSATIKESYSGYKTFYRSSITGKYLLKGSHSDGAIHGPLTLDANINFSATNGEKEYKKYSFRGSFKEGVPEGNFKVDYPSYGIKVNVNYKNGILVGQYQVKGIDRGLPFNRTGTLTADGKPTGVWKYDYASGVEELTFLNGVVINKSSYDAGLSAKAKSYASGTISKEDLEKENIFVIPDSMSLGSDAWNQILHDGIAWDKLGYYAFSSSEYVRFSYLMRLPFFNEKGLEVLKKCVLDNDRYAYEGDIYFDKVRNMYRCRIHKSSVLADYCTGYPDWSNYFVDVYLTNEQFTELCISLHEARKANIDKQDIYSLYNPQISDFEQCSYDESVVVYNKEHSHFSGLVYYSWDTFAEYFIKEGKIEELMNFVPETRKDVVKVKIDKYKESCGETIKKWFEDNVLNTSYNNIYYEIRNNVDMNFFPIISYSVDSIELVNGKELEVHSLVNVSAGELGYKTYRLVLYGYINEGSVNMNVRKTFKASNFINVKNDYDVISELDFKIDENDKKIGDLAKDAFQKDYSLYQSYRESLDFSIDHNDLKASIDKRKEVLAIQEHVAVFVEKLTAVYSGDNEVSTKCADIKDVSKAYNAYLKTRDLSWSPATEFERIDKYIEINEKCLEFVELRHQVQENDAQIKELKSAASNIYKAYKNYVKERDLTWTPEVDFTQIRTLIDIQERYLVFVEKEDIKTINKSVKKQEIDDIVKILEMN